MTKENDLIRVKFLLKQIETIQNDLSNVSLEEFEKSDLLARATAFSLMQIGEQMNRLEESYRDLYPDLPWKDARDMRNIIVHVYSKVDAAQVYMTATKDLNILEEYFEKIKNDII